MTIGQRALLHCDHSLTPSWRFCTPTSRAASSIKQYIVSCAVPWAPCVSPLQTQCGPATAMPMHRRALGHFAAILTRGDFRSIHPPAGDFVCPTQNSTSRFYSSLPIYLWRLYNNSMTVHLIEDWTPLLAHQVRDWQRTSR